MGPIVTDTNSNTIAKCLSSRWNPNVSTCVGHWNRLRPPPPPPPPPPPLDDELSPSPLIILPSGPILVLSTIVVCNCVVFDERSEMKNLQEEMRQSHRTKPSQLILAPSFSPLLVAGCWLQFALCMHWLSATTLPFYSLEISGDEEVL